MRPESSIQNGRKPEQMADDRIRIRIEEDGLTALATVSPGPPPEGAGLAAALDAAEVQHGIDANVALEITAGLEDPDFACTDLPIARGTPAVAGRDGELRLDFEVGLKAGTEREDESLDFLERQMLTPASVGQQIALLVAPTEGSPGVDVRALEIPTRAGKPMPLTLLEGVELGEDGAIVASTAGVILYLHRKSISVVSHHKHSGDVDLRSGNLDMEGSLSISGSVTRNLTVSTSGDCEVAREVDGGIVVAGGSILIRGRIHRDDCGRVSADGDVSCRHVEGGEILAGGALRIANDSIGGALHAHEVEIGRRAMGGEIRAEVRIAVREAGSAAGAGTHLAAAVPIVRPVIAAREMHGRARNQRASRRDRAGRGGGDKHRGRGPRMRTLDERQVAAKQREQREEVRKYREEAEIRLDIGHEGVRVSIGDSSLFLENTVRDVRFRYDASSKGIVMETRMSNLGNLRARDLMSRNLETIEAKATLRQAASQMSELRIHCLLVPPSDTQGSIGILTCKDIVQLLGDEPPEVLDEIRVKDAMTSPAITLQEPTALPDRILLMRMFGVRSVPVLRADELVGLLSFTDILDSVASSRYQGCTQAEE